MIILILTIMMVVLFVALGKKNERKLSKATVSAYTHKICAIFLNKAKKV
jgi:hypothetical protein